MTVDNTRTNDSKRVLTIAEFEAIAVAEANASRYVAIRSKSPRSKCYFYNVYLKEAFQAELNKVTVSNADCFALLQLFDEPGLNFTVKQKNAKGFYQAQVSYSFGNYGEPNNELHMLTAEAGTRGRAIQKLFVYHLLVWEPDMEVWRCTDKLMRDADDF